MTMGHGQDIDEAVYVACRAMHDLLTHEWALSPEDAIMLMSVSADVGVCQCADAGTFPCVARVALPKMDGIAGPFLPSSKTIG